MPILFSASTLCFVRLHLVSFELSRFHCFGNERRYIKNGITRRISAPFTSDLGNLNALAKDVGNGLRAKEVLRNTLTSMIGFSPVNAIVANMHPHRKETYRVRFLQICFFMFSFCADVPGNFAEIHLFLLYSLYL